MYFSFSLFILFVLRITSIPYTKPVGKMHILLSVKANGTYSYCLGSVQLTLAMIRADESHCPLLVISNQHTIYAAQVKCILLSQGLYMQ